MQLGQDTTHACSLPSLGCTHCRLKQRDLPQHPSRSSCGLQGLRTVFQDQLKTEAPPPPEPLPAAAYGKVVLAEAAALLDHLDVLARVPVISRVPLPMEQYGQGCGWMTPACLLKCDQLCACF